MSRERVSLVADPYPPYQFEKAGVVVGQDCETIAQAFAELPYDLVVELLPWEECLRRVDDGTADGVFQVTRTAERESRYLFSDLLRTEEAALISRRDRIAAAPASKTARDLIGSGTLGVLRGYNYGPEVDAIPDRQKLHIAEQTDLVVALVEGSCDFMLLDAGVAGFVASQLGIEDLQRMPGFAVRRDLFVAFGRGRETLVRHFNQGLRILRKQ